MNKTYADIIKLVKSAVTGKPADLLRDLDWDEIILYSCRHKIEVLIYNGLYNSNIEIPSEYSASLKKLVLSQAILDANQEYEISVLTNAFDKNKITYLPLKGMLLKKYYPKSEMRYMCDADILIKPEEFDTIINVMNELGYSFKLESNHEHIWVKNSMNIELHKRLIPSYNKDYYEYYGDGWRLAKQIDGKYVMSNEVFYIYLFTHLAKHYRDNGIGIKQFVDLWVYRNANADLNYSYINQELKKLQLYDFHINCINMLNCWFEEAVSTDITDYMTDFIFSSGVYGTAKTGVLSAALKETLMMKNKDNLRRKFYIRKIFLPYKDIKTKYPVLERLPILLPVMWIVRIFNILLFNRKSIKTNAEKLNMLTNENIDAYEEALSYVGLKFDFKETEQ